MKNVHTMHAAKTHLSRLVARACLNCHNAIHGSNAPGNRGKFFTR